MAFSVRHNAPAGEAYGSICEAGKALLSSNGLQILEGRGNVLLPPIFVNEFTEAKGKGGSVQSRQLHTKQEVNAFRGILNRKHGEDNEVLIHKYFDHLLHDRSQSLENDSLHHQHMVLKGLTMEKFKINALLYDFPKLENQIKTFLDKNKVKNHFKIGETDFIVIVKDLGFVAVEVKSSEGQILEGRRQCERIENFAKIIFSQYSATLQLPVTKLVIVCSDDSHPDTTVTEEVEIIKKDERLGHFIMDFSSSITLNMF